MTETLATKSKNRVFGNRPAHIHTCIDDQLLQHSWQCNSPYCEEREVNCPEHGGLEPIVIGREPWRGMGLR